MNWQIILNPFTKFSEKQLLLIGIGAAIAGNAIASILGITYDGVIDVHVNTEMTFIESLKENTTSIILITLLLFILGKAINTKTRFIDILNSALFFRIPFYIMALLASLPIIRNMEQEVVKNINSLEKITFGPVDLIGIIVISILLMVLLIYAIALLFRGFKTATNAKKTIHYICFGLAIIIAEVLSKIILQSI